MNISWDDYQLWLSSTLSSELPTQSTAPCPNDFNLDSRSIKEGQWFVAFSGDRVNGHQFIEAAMKAGACGFIYEDQHKHLLASSLLEKGIGVKSSLEALQQIGKGWRNKLKHIQVLALTGSVGKTTCKEMLSTITSFVGATHSTSGNYNNELGVALTLLGLKPEHQFAVIEMGARKPHDIKTLTALAQPNVSCCLNATNAHLEIFESRENLIKTKLEIISETPSNKPSVVFGDDPILLKNAKASGRTLLTFGRQKSVDLRITKEDWLEDGSMLISFNYKGTAFDIRLPQAHQAYPLNAAAAAAAALICDITPLQIASALKEFKNISRRFTIKTMNDFTLIDDTYNANPDSMRSGLESLNKGFPHAKKILVIGDMLELGKESLQEHEKLGTLCVQLANPQLLITVGEHSLHTHKQAITNGFPKERLKHYSSINDLLDANLPFHSYGNLIYAKGSNGIKLNKLIESLTTS